MRSSGQIVGIALISVGIILGILIAAWLAAGVASDDLETTGALLGGTLGFIVLVAPLVGGGVLVLLRARTEDVTMRNVRRQRQLLGIIGSAGEISIADLALETRGTRDSVRNDLYDLVSKGLFSGYVDWDRGQLYARDASELRSFDTCQNCGSELTLAGKGLITCDYCGAEYFLP